VKIVVDLTYKNMHKITHMSLQKLAPSVNWLTDNEMNNIYTSKFWNDEEQEKPKAWWILDNNFNKLWDYLKSSKLY